MILKAIYFNDSVMTINVIVCTDSDQGIGRDGRIPWECKEDLRYFKEKTCGTGRNAVVMGRRTYDSLPRGMLPGRHNFVISRSLDRASDLESSLLTFSSRIEDVLAKEEQFDEMWIIGGATIYNHVLSKYPHLVKEIHIRKSF